MSENSFDAFDLKPELITALHTLGYHTPTYIQAQSIPILLDCHDLSAQAQTGTGKTASFALPILSNLDLAIKAPQALIITPTRELAIQVTEAFKNYAKRMKSFQAASIYGGQDFKVQLRALKQGAHVVVGTPGRIMDHLRRNTLRLLSLKTLILDEADEMLKMGFVDDVEWILEQIPHTHQMALFSATMPSAIQKISKKYLKNPKTIQIKPKEMSDTSIEQIYTCVPKDKKIHVLIRFLEVEPVQAAIIFSRTKTYSSELAEKLQAQGYTAAALNGDMHQSSREKVIERLKKGSLDIIVATDVAARGIDVDRVSHVINYDVPYDAESYIHRIGRTGRAGRAGKALLIISPREYRLLKEIERTIQKNIQKIDPPSVKEIRQKRQAQLVEKINQFINNDLSLSYYAQAIEAIEAQGHDLKHIAAALLHLLQKVNPVHSEEIETVNPRSESIRRPNYNRSSDSRNFARNKRRRSQNRDFKSDFGKKNFSRRDRSFNNY